MKIRIIFLLVFIFSGLDSFACVCDNFFGYPPVEMKHLNQRDYQIIIARVLRIQNRLEPEYTDTTGRTAYEKSLAISVNIVTVAILKKYGHEIKTDTIDIKTGTFPTLDCGFPFIKHKIYLITLAGNWEKQSYGASICMPTRQLLYAKSDIEFIERNIPSGDTTLAVYYRLTARKFATASSSAFGKKNLKMTLGEALSQFKLDTLDCFLSAYSSSNSYGIRVELSDSSMLFLQIKAAKNYGNDYSKIMKGKIIGIGLVFPDCKQKRWGRGFLLTEMWNPYCRRKE